MTTFKDTVVRNQTDKVAGVDEVGRGPLAGPVLAAAVILDPNCPIEGLKDSKALLEPRRCVLAEQIKAVAIAWAVGRVDVEDIDRINILQASLLAMERAVALLAVEPSLILIDGNKIPHRLPCPAQSFIKGDTYINEISAASIIAKVTRDKEMVEMAKIFPEYGFDKHKGYPTKQHMMALIQHGVTSIHRKSYAPVRKLLQ